MLTRDKKYVGFVRDKSIMAYCVQFRHALLERNGTYE